MSISATFARPPYGTNAASSCPSGERVTCEYFGLPKNFSTDGNAATLPEGALDEVTGGTVWAEARHEQPAKTAAKQNLRIDDPSTQMEIPSRTCG